jgi:ATP-binding cassette, subfamily B, bacterial
LNRGDRLKNFPFYKQQDVMDCGPTCLRMIAKHYGRNVPIDTLRRRSGINKLGVSLYGISEGATTLGLSTLGVKVTLDQLASEAPMPCVVHWQQGHFVVVYEITRTKVRVADPGLSLLTYTHAEFLQGWKRDEQNRGIALLVEPTPQFYDADEELPQVQRGIGWQRLVAYTLLYKPLLWQLGFSLVAASAIQLIFPFLTQSVVDIGVYTQDLSYIQLVLLAQLLLTLGRVSVEFVRAWLLLYVSTRLNLSILSDFFIKLMRLPLHFFDSKHFGDIMQRINDHHRIQQFLTGTSLQVLFSSFNLLIFGFVLAFYHLGVFMVFALGSGLYALWIVAFLKKRRELDFKQFSLNAQNQSSVVQLIQGMQEIKLANAETPKRWEWERLQVRHFKLGMKGLALGQYQQAGAVVLNEGKNIFITFLAAQAVVQGQLTLGAMLAMQYIIGQLNGPIQDLIQFIQQLQDASISLERINEVHTQADETSQGVALAAELPAKADIKLNKLSFRYDGTEEMVLKDLDITIPEGKTTAIVGTSGSGKTTLIKLLLKFYEPTQGDIRVGGLRLSYLDHGIWRGACGTVLQDGFLFSDTIARNIAVGDEYIDQVRLVQAAEVANILPFIESIPLGFHTKIGAEGLGVSQGQRQRILIARAVYKNPQFIFLDEATNALDALNEKQITQRLDHFFAGRTVVVVAHRLSTVKNADNIIVLEKGRLVEQGTHHALIVKRGKYFELVSNQLELGA